MGVVPVGDEIAIHGVRQHPRGSIAVAHEFHEALFKLLGEFIHEPIRVLHEELHLTLVPI